MELIFFDTFLSWNRCFSKKSREEMLIFSTNPSPKSKLYVLATSNSCSFSVVLILLIYSIQFECISSTTTTVTNSNSSELAIDVCKNTTNYNLCVEALYSDPRTPTADRYVLAYISFDLAYVNATATRAYIDQLLENNKNTNSSRELIGLKSCQGYYEKAVRDLAEAINDLDSETFFELGMFANDSGHAARNCEFSFHGNPPLNLSAMNSNLRVLCNICFVVSKLFNVS